VTSAPSRLLAALAVTVCATAWVGGLVLAPSLARHVDDPRGAALAAAVLYTAGTVVCHQVTTRSFHIEGVRMPVCARCAGLYAGAAAGMLLWWGTRRRQAARLWMTAPVAALALVAVPTALTWGAAMVGLWDPGNLTRAVAALPLGLVTGTLVTAAISGDLQ
jgi:uncharacterized membrane protein